MPNNNVKSPQPDPFYPLTSDLFDLLLELEVYTLNAKYKSNGNEEIMTDGVAIFNIVIGKLIKQGVKFSSPGNSMKRHFILWFNSRFTQEDIYSHKIEVEDKYFILACEMLDKIKFSIK